MDDMNYKSNSHKHRDEEKKMESTNSDKKPIGKVISGTVKTKKKSEIKKLVDSFIADDLTKIKSYVIAEVLIPSIKKALSDIIINSSNILLFKEVNPKRRDGTGSSASYRDYYDRRGDDRSIYSRRPSPYNYDEIVVETRSEAEAVLDRMDELIAQYGLVRVADLYEMVGITGSYTDSDYGWTNIASAKAIPVRDGYLLKLPRALPLR